MLALPVNADVFIDSERFHLVAKYNNALIILDLPVPPSPPITIVINLSEKLMLNNKLTFLLSTKRYPNNQKIVYC